MSEKVRALLGDHFVKSGNNRVTSEELTGKYVGILFGASWCRRSRDFISFLSAVYPQLKARHPFEIVYVSNDHTVESYEQFVNQMGWLALPYEDRARKSSLCYDFQLRGMPKLAIINENGKILNYSAEISLASDTQCQHFPWEIAVESNPQLANSIQQFGMFNIILAIVIFILLVYLKKNPQILDSLHNYP